ncbi:amidohydrolase [Brucella anthropi]|uniref:Amidohydrolase n=1 Tax=Brucella anthropi TaxID=529 RepID=A0A6I0DJQ4_BRUAN|nr:amidohydrolase [Brucella anthropi]
MGAGSFCLSESCGGSVKNDDLNLDRITGLVDAKAGKFCALSDRIWDVPELAFAEEKACAEHISALREEGFLITSCKDGLDTAFVAEFGDKGPVMAFLGEYDALPDLSQAEGAISHNPLISGAPGHGCGHNLLGSGAALAAVALKDALVEAGLEGRVRYYGCPAEESGSGKSFMARSGYFDDVDVAFCWHPNVVNEAVTTSSLAFYQCYFRFSGKAAHAAASPHLGRSALDAVELMNVGVNYMREHMPADARIHYAITNTGGIAPNVVQANAEVLYLIRSPKIEDAETLFARVKKIAEGAALMTETKVTSQITDAGMNLLPNKVLLRVLHDNMVRIGAPDFDGSDRTFARELQNAALSREDIEASAKNHGEDLLETVLHDGILDMPAYETVMAGSTDVGDVSWIVPTVQCHAACFAFGTPFHTWQLVTQGRKPAAHKGLMLAAKTLASTAAECLRRPELIAKAKDELKARTRGRAYICPIPADVTPEHLKPMCG